MMTYKNPIPSGSDISGGTTTETTNSDYMPVNTVYFAFIDMLGFKKAFEDTKISQDTSNINSIREVFNYYFALMNAANFMRNGKESGCYAGQTSDSLYFYTERIDFLLQFIKIFSHFNMFAMSKNIFFRGGIAKGTLFKKENYQFYGDSVIGAYSIESNISKYPIIVVDEKTYFDLTTYENCSNLFDYNYSNERHYIKPFEYIDCDMNLDISRDFEIAKIDKQKIIENIKKNIDCFEYDEKNYGKYMFLKKQMDKNQNKT